MGYFEESVRSEFTMWEQRVTSFLLESMTVEDIDRLIKDCRISTIDFHKRAKQKENLSRSNCNAILGLSIIRELLDQIKQPLPENIPIEFAARFSRDAFNAGNLIGMSAPGRGVEVLTSQMVSVREVAEREALSKNGLKAIAVRHAPLNEFKEKAAEVARLKWEQGSSLLHHQMVKFLIEEYKDENGKYPFMCLPDSKNSSPDKVLLKKMKEVAKDLRRIDLISGLKK